MAEDIAVSMLTSPSVATLGDSFRGVCRAEGNFSSLGMTISLACVGFGIRFVISMIWPVSRLSLQIFSWPKQTVS